MTHQKSLFNPKLAFEDIKQSKHVIILYTVALLLCTLLPAALSFSNYHDKETYFYLNSCAEFLSLAKPQYAVVSVGVNSYALPSVETISRMESVGAKVLRTDKSGTVLFKITNEEIKVNTDY